MIPCFRDGAHLPATLASLEPLHDLEVVVADASEDPVPLPKGVQRISARRGRGLQMNAGAEAARGTYLLFLHADTTLATGAIAAADRALANPKVSGGAFSLRIAAANRRLAVVAKLANWRARYLGLSYGDQGLFVRRRTFQDLGGFSTDPIFEDLDLVQRLRSVGRVVVLPEVVITSGRRWRTHGIWKTTRANQGALLRRALGCSPDRIRSWYEQQLR